MKKNIESKELINMKDANVFKRVLNFFKNLFIKPSVTIYDGTNTSDENINRFSFKTNQQLKKLIGDIEILTLQEKLSKKEIFAEDLSLKELDEIISLYNDQLKDLDSLFRKKKNELTILSYRLKAQKEKLIQKNPK